MVFIYGINKPFLSPFTKEVKYDKPLAVGYSDNNKTIIDKQGQRMLILNSCDELISLVDTGKSGSSVDVITGSCIDGDTIYVTGYSRIEKGIVIGSEKLIAYNMKGKVKEVLYTREYKDTDKITTPYFNTLTINNHMKRRKHVKKLIALATVIAFAWAFMPALDDDCNVSAATKKPAQVKNLSVDGIDNNTQVQFSWDKAKNAKKYQIYEKNSSGKYKRVKTVVKNTAVMSAEAGTHTYKVRGVNGSKAGKFSTAEKVVLTVNYTDLGDYVIDLGTMTADDIERGIAEFNRQNEQNEGDIDMYNPDIFNDKGGFCTAIAKKNSHGQVIVGRNQDMEVSNYPVYISHLDGYGKYQAVSFFYTNKGKYTYKELQKGLEFDPDHRAGLAVASTDAFNEEGLYIQCNMRTAVGIRTTSTNPGKLRTGMITAAALAAQNAATAQEAVDYIKNELDIYSCGKGDFSWDYAYLIGDKTGRYCVLEFAKDKVYVTWDKDATWDREKLLGQANYFVSKDVHKDDPYAAGEGRLAFALDSGYDEAETATDMLNTIHAADWYHEILDMKYSYKDDNEEVHFVNKDGGSSIDWRSELTLNIAVDDDGNIVWDESELDPETQLKYHMNCTLDYLKDPKNFEQVKAFAMKRFEGNDVLINKFFGWNGYEMDKQPIRDKGDVFTTGMNFGVNCHNKYMKVRFLEDENAIYEFQWDNGKLEMHK